MTNIGHFRAAGKLLEEAENVPTRLWIVPPTKMDQHQLTEENYYKILKIQEQEQKFLVVPCAWVIKQGLKQIQL